MAKLIDNKEGIYSLMFTPFNEDYSVDYKTYEQYAQWQAASGVGHLFSVCGTSEMSSLTLEERLKLASLTVKNKGNTFVVATANMEAVDANEDEVKRMTETGVDGLVLVTKGLGDKPQELVEYIGKLKAATHLPVYMYEFPGARPHCISGETYGRLVRECGIVGIKDTTCTMEGITSKIAQKGDSVIIQANMPYLYDAFVAGARGVMSTITACGSAFFSRFYNAFVSGDMKLCEKRYHEIMHLDNAMGDGFNITGKYLVALQGIPVRPINRDKREIAPQKYRTVQAFYDWCVNEGLM